MKLDIRNLGQGQTLPFVHSLDLSGMEFSGRYPAARPVTVEGEVRNHAGALVFTARMSALLSLRCDRCDCAFEREMVVRLDLSLADSVEDEESEGIALLDGGFCDVDEITVPAFVLEMDTKNLCSEDCAGLCPRCGQNLNGGPCGCATPVDPRLEGLISVF